MGGRLLALVFVLLLSTLSATCLSAQPQVCGPGAQMTPLCADACIICDINGFSGRNGNPTTQWNRPTGFCAPQPENIRWIGFIAGSTNLSLNISVSNCSASNNGLQFGLYQSNCVASGNRLVAATSVSNCIPLGANNGTTTTLTTSQPLVVGQYYYLVIDGRNNDVCDYSVAVTSGSTAVPTITQGGGLTGPLVACPNRPATYSTNAVVGAPTRTWTVNGSPQSGNGLTQTLTFPGPGTYQVCVTASNVCNTGPQECQTVVVNPTPNTNVPASICVGQSYTFNGITYSNPGTYTSTLQTTNGCDSIVRLILTQAAAVSLPIAASTCAGTTLAIRPNLNLGPGTYAITVPGPGCDTTLNITITALQPVTTALTQQICQGQSFSFGGQTLTTSGSFTQTLIRANGCDSVVNLTLQVDPNPVTNLTLNLCAGESFTIGTEVFSGSGSVTRTLLTAAGCDSVINLNLTVLPSLTATRAASICQGTSYQLGNQSFSSAGTYTVTFPGPSGCDSTVTLNLSSRLASVSNTTASICPGNSYSFGGNSYVNAGTFTVRLVNAVGCDSTATLNLSINSVIRTNESATVCNGQSFVFNGTSYSASGSYAVTLPSAAGCDSIHTLNLTVRPPAGTIRTETVCFGESRQIGAETFTTSGSYTRVLTSVHNCDSTVVLNLTVRPAAVAARSYRICEGASVRVGPQVYRDPGTYTIRFPGPNGCDSTVTLTLAVDLISLESPVVTICAGETYQLGSQSLGSSGNYTARLVAANGCDSLVNLTLTVANEIRATVQATVCDGESYVFNGQSYTTAGSYPVRLTSAGGCDSVVTLQLAVDASSSATLNPQICLGQSFRVGAQTFNATGTYTVTLPSASGCDSVVTLNLTVARPTAASVDTTICTGEFYLIAGQALVTAGSYNFTLVNAAGCDSTVSLRLRVANPSLTTVTARFCTGTNYVFQGQTYDQGGSYSILLQSRAGCDSLIQLNLFEESILTTQLTETICAGEVYRFDDLRLSTSGRYTKNYTTGAGCDSTVTLDLSVVTALATNLAVTRCAGEVYRFNGVDRTASGVFTANLQSVNGCDSTVTLNLTVLPPLSTALRDTVCAGESIRIGGQTFSTTGRHSVTLTGRGGCDSVITLDLRVRRLASAAVQRTICAGGAVMIGSQTFSDPGTYTVSLQTPAGCDSTVTLTLAVGAAVSFTERRDLCAGESTTYRNVVYARSGTYNLTFPGSGGACDTLVTLTVAVASPLSGSTAATICAGQLFDFEGRVLATAGVYTSTLSSSGGCDSVVTLTLSVQPALVSAFAKTICAGATETFGGQALSTTGAYTQTLRTASGCDSTVTLNLTVRPAIPDTRLRRTICAGGSITVAGQVFSASGTYPIPLRSSAGCDSLVVLELSLGTSVEIDTSFSVCAGETVRYRGTDYGAAGTFTLSAPGVGADCDTVIALRVTAGASVQTAFAKTICDGATETFGGQTLSTSGVYTQSLRTASGCDSTVTLNLTVRQAIPDTRLRRTICAGGSVTVAGQVFSASGTYPIPLLNSDGCDSLVILELSLGTSVEIDTSFSICAGETVRYRGTDYGAAGTFTLSAPGVGADCDSVITLRVTAGASVQTAFAKTICAGATETFGGQTLSTSGVYTQTLRAASGCDSVVTLNLTVSEPLMSIERVSICAGTKYFFAGDSLSRADTYTQTFTSQMGCDSVATLELSLLPTPRIAVVAAICAGGSYTFGNQQLTSAGVYERRLTTSRGCDSVRVLTLTLVDSIVVETAQSICTGETFTFGAQALSIPGTYRSMHRAASGCDSISVLHLAVVDTLVTQLSEQLCAGDSLSFGGSFLHDAGRYVRVLPSASGCDSLVRLELRVNERYAQNLTGEICAGQRFLFGGRSLTRAGTYTENLMSNLGCDSVVTLQLGVVDTLRQRVDVAICTGGTYRFGNLDLQAAGTYRLVGTASSGCDSVTELSLRVEGEINTLRFDTLCAGESITFGGEVRTVRGQYVERFMAIGGCDSIVTLELWVRDALTGRVDTTLCLGENLVFAGQTFSQAGDYPITLTAASGCDSVVTLRISPEVCGVPLGGVTVSTSCFGGRDGQADIYLSGLVAPVNLRWESPGGGREDSVSIPVLPQGAYTVEGLPAGAYSFTAMDSRGQTAAILLEVTEPPALVSLLRVDRRGGFAIDCARQTSGSANIEVAGGTPPYGIAWSDGRSGPVATGLGVGWIGVAVTDARGCLLLDSTLLNEPPPLNLELERLPIDCALPEAGGAVAVKNLTGGLPPYRYWLDQQAITSQPNWEGLPAGTYRVFVSDSLNCEASGEITIDAPETPKLDLGVTRILEVGDTLRLEVLSTTALDSVRWTASVAGYISCDTCVQTRVAPVETTDYRVIVWAAGGCAATDELRLIVRQRPGIYTPTAFSPNGDGVNDGFTVYSEESGAIIESISVFDRWGEHIWTRSNLPTGDPELGWRGDFRGQPLDPAVFVFVATVRRGDGRLETIKGDLTLLR